MPSYYDAECLKCDIPLGNFATKARAEEAMRQHERMFHGAVENISFKSRRDPTFKKSRKNSIFDMLNL